MVRILKKLLIASATILRSMWIIGKQAFSKRETLLYPEEPVNLSPRYRGRIILTRDPDGNERCVACGLCAVVCPVGCISLQKSEKEDERWYPEYFRINFSRCIFCGLCEEACPTTAIQLTSDFEMSEFKRKDLIYEKEDLLISGPGKYTDYNFYKVKGRHTPSSKDNDSNTADSHPVDVRDILP